MRTALAAMALTALLALAVGCGADSRDGKGPEGQAPAGPGAGAETPKPGENTPTTPTRKPGETPAARAGALGWLGYVTDDFFAAVVVRPRKIIDSPVLKGLPVQSALDDMKSRTRLDPDVLDELVVLFRAPGANGGPGEMPAPGMIVKFVPGTGAKTFFEKLVRSPLDEGEIDGKKLYRGEEGDFSAVESGGRWIVSDEKTMRKMAAGTGGKSALAQRLKAADPQAEMFAVVLLDPVRQIAKETAEMAKEAGGVPAPLVPVMGAADHLSAAAITLSLSGAQPLAAVLEGTSGKSAEELEKMAQGLLMLGKIWLASTREEIGSKPDADAVKPALSLADDVAAGIRIARDGAKVSITLKRPKGLDDLATIFAPAVVEAQAAAGRAARMNNLKKVAVAMHNFHSASQRLPAPAMRDKEGKATLSWRVAILPYLEQQALYERFRLDEPWDSEHNKKVAEQMPDIYKTPGAKPGTTSIMVFTGEGTPFGGEKGMALFEVKDGLSNTILCVEAGPDKAVPWSKPEDLKFDKEAPVAALGTLAEGQFLAAMLDGAVRVIKTTIDPAVLRALVQHADGEAVDPAKF